MSGDIIFLPHRVPYPPNRGDKIRSWNVLKGLARLAPVHVIALADDPADMNHAGTIGEVAASVHLIPHRTHKLGAVARALVSGGSASVNACASRALANRVAEVAASQTISTYYAFSGQMAQYVPEQRNGADFIMDFVDMDSAKFATWGEGTGVAAMANRFEATRLFRFEQAVAARADVSLFVSEAEATLFRSRTGLSNAQVQTVENGIDLVHYHPDHAALALDQSTPLIVFTGQMDYPPNVEAVVHFARNVLPRVQQVIDGAQFAIVGRAPVADVQALAGLTGVTVTGAVDDPRDWIAAADLIVAPLLLARGVQNKVLEAMAMGKAVLASGPAAEGIDARDGQDFVIANGMISQAEAAISLLRSPARRQALGEAARTRMETRYGWDATLAPLAGLIQKDCATRKAA